MLRFDEVETFFDPIQPNLSAINSSVSSSNCLLDAGQTFLD